MATITRSDTPTLESQAEPLLNRTEQFQLIDDELDYK